MRPVSSNIDAPCERVAKWLVVEFSRLEPPKSLSVKNSIEFVERLEGVKVRRNEEMASIDVTSLFPSIPIKKTMLLLRNWLVSLNMHVEYVDMYVDLTQLCMNQNQFQFRDKFYRQRDGTSMGNALSGFVAEIYMADFEVRMSRDMRFPRVWIRYVDDIFVVVNKRKLDSTIEWLNSMERSIKFTKEREVDGRLPFLDLMVINNGIGLEFDIYRKSTFSKRFITSDSFHSFKHKMAAFNAMDYRLVSIPLSISRYNVEREYIIALGKINGYARNYIDDIIRKHERKHHLLELSTLFQSNDNNETKRVCFPYFQNVTNQLASIYSDIGLEMVHRNDYTLHKYLGSAKDRIPDLLKSGIYEIECQDGCNFAYYGMTERNPVVRFGEHMDCVRRSDCRSGVARHLVEYGHTIDVSKLKLIQPVNSRNTRVFECYEKLHIVKNRKCRELMNLNDGNVNSILFDLV
jgi:hypothetical protein